MGLFLAGLLPGFGKSGPTKTPTPASKLVLWDQAFDVRLGMGYKNNILLRHQNPQGSPFWLTAFDWMVWRESLQGPQFTFFLSGEDLRYLESTSVEKEQTLMGDAELTKDLGPDWRVGLEGDYFYMNAVYDASTTEGLFETIQAVGHTLEVAPSLRRKWDPFYAKIDFPLTRQLFKEPLDNYWEGGPRFRVGVHYGYRSSASVVYTFNQRFYDKRRQPDPLGHPILATHLQYHQDQVALEIRHYFDPRRRWRSTTRFSWLNSQDNGSGFFDYQRLMFSQGFRFEDKKWMAEIELRLSRYNYDNQPSSPTDPTKRQQTIFGISLRGERRLSHSLRLFASYRYQHARSRSFFDDYAASVMRGGVEYDF